MKKTVIAIKIATSLTLILSLCSCANTPDKTLDAAESSYVQQNYGVTFATLRNSANGGDPRAQYALGYLYYYGMGTQTDPVAAIKWFTLAANQGNTAAIQALKTIQGQQPATVDSTPPSANNNDPKIGPPTRTIVKPQNKALPTPNGYAKNPAYSANQNLNSGNGNNTINNSNSGSSNNTINSSNNISRQGNLTLRLFANYDQNKAQAFIHDNNLTNNATINTSKIGGNTLYTVTYGRYSTMIQAQNAIKSLPAALQSTKPWVQKAD